jgi:hypothetical protein
VATSIARSARSKNPLTAGSMGFANRRETQFAR